MSITFLQLVEKVLTEEKQPLSATEIWQVAQNKGYDLLVGSNGNTPGMTMGARLYVDVRDNPQTVFMTIGTNPKRFILKSQQGLFDPLTTEPPKTPALSTPKFDYLEKDLHPFMVYYGFYYLKAFLKTINHTKSDKKGFGEWVHPDIVGCYFPYKDWGEEVTKVSALMGNTAVKLYSFELKRELSLGNLRETFFQAVSNSSWANEGYLVAAQIDDDGDFRSELKRLSISFGIGVIQLNIQNPDSSTIVLPAKTKDLVDWETVNKLAGMNPDFKDFLKRIQKDMNNQEVRKELYDKVWEKEELVKTLVKSKT